MLVSNRRAEVSTAEGNLLAPIVMDIEFVLSRSGLLATHFLF